MRQIFKGKKKIDGLKSAVEALRGLDSKSQARVLAEIFKKDPEMAEKIRKNMRGFDDLLKVNPQGLIRLIQEVPEPILVLALRGQNPAFVQTFLKPLAQRKAALITEALTHLGPQPISKVETAKREVLSKACELESQGKIIFSEGEDPLV